MLPQSAASPQLNDRFVRQLTSIPRPRPEDLVSQLALVRRYAIKGSSGP